MCISLVVPSRYCEETVLLVIPEKSICVLANELTGMLQIT